MMFGLGMANNGTALVLATAALPHRPQVLLPIIAYNLAQQIVAGIASRSLSQPERPAEDSEGSGTTPRRRISAATGRRP